MEARVVDAAGAGAAGGRRRRRRPPKKNPNAPTVRPSVLTDPGDAGPRETLRQPKRKPGNNKKYLKVLPTGMTAATAQTWRANNNMPPLSHDLGTYHTYEGIFDGHGVQIRGEPDLFWLHYQGCFGKANLSKSEPLHHRVVRDLAAGVTERATVEEKRVERKQRRVERNERRKQQKQQRQKNEAAKRRREKQEKKLLLRRRVQGGEKDEETEQRQRETQEDEQRGEARDKTKGAGKQRDAQRDDSHEEQRDGPESKTNGSHEDVCPRQKSGGGGRADPGHTTTVHHDMSQEGDAGDGASATAAGKGAPYADSSLHETSAADDDDDDDEDGDDDDDIDGRRDSGAGSGRRHRVDDGVPEPAGARRSPHRLPVASGPAHTETQGAGDNELPNKRAKRTDQGAASPAPHMQWTEVAVTDVPPEMRGRTVIEATKEVLQLSLVEAFFLLHGLGCLRILDERGRNMSALECWRSFRAAQPTFVQRYVVYHHLRTSGWIPKSGLKFAVDFLAYRQGPAYYHSSFSVCVKTAWEDTLEPWAPDTRQLPWHSLLNLVRMSNQAGKEPVMCHVLRPRHIADSDLDHPNCLASMRVLQVLPRRWVPERTRANTSA